MHFVVQHKAHLTRRSAFHILFPIHFASRLIMEKSSYICRRNFSHIPRHIHINNQWWHTYFGCSEEQWPRHKNHKIQLCMSSESQSSSTTPHFNIEMQIIEFVPHSNDCEEVALMPSGTWTKKTEQIVKHRVYLPVAATTHRCETNEYI